MLTPSQAVRSILEDIPKLPPERRPLQDALGKVLAKGITSPIDLPHWDNSAMDGYAVRSEDISRGIPLELQVIEEIPAGAFPSKSIGAGECARIFTGAPVPAGADGVIRQEDTTPLDDNRVRINDDRDAGRNVRRQGEDIRRDTAVLERGTELRPAQVGVLASIAEREVLVYRPPQVAIMASGDEIVDLDERDAILSGRKIATSNTYTLLSMIRQAGGEPVNTGIAKDDPQDLRGRIMSAATADLLVTSAGVSVGEHDLLRSVLEDMGAKMKFWRIRMRPGAPVGFGLLAGLPWIGLPGNPVSSMVTGELFVRPAIRKMLGHTKLFRRTVPVRLDEPIKTHALLRHFLRVVVEWRNGELTAKLTGDQGSGILTSMVKADALLIVPEDRQQIQKGETLDAMLLDEAVHVEEVPF